MKKFTLVNYLSAEWRYIGEEENGVRLRSTCKNVADLIVPYSRKNQIKIGAYQSSTYLKRVY